MAANKRHYKEGNFSNKFNMLAPKQGRTCFIELVPEKELRVDTPSNSKNSGMQEHPKRDKYLKSIGPKDQN